MPVAQALCKAMTELSKYVVLKLSCRIFGGIPPPGCRCRSLSRIAGSQHAANLTVGHTSWGSDASACRQLQDVNAWPVLMVYSPAMFLQYGKKCTAEQWRQTRTSCFVTVQHRLWSTASKTLLCLHAGMRFPGADTTVKLRQDTTYIISITTQPAVAVT
jgi:hypothetical protein